MLATAPGSTGAERAIDGINRRGPAYRAFVVGVILLASILSYADRMILSVLAESIKHDLHITDAQLGFLFGTSFVIFTGLAGLASARIADGWLRNRLLAIGILFWSALTTFSGLARSHTQLALARFGVGLGESTIGPVGHAVLADLFPPSQRSRVFAIYLSGSFLGPALCIGLAGWLVGQWPQTCGGLGLCQLHGWQAAFFLFGAPGLVVALLVLAIGEPADPVRRRLGRPLRDGLTELALIVPPFNLFHLGGARAVRRNLTAAAAIAALAALAIRLTGDVAQWVAVGLAAHALLSWMQGLKQREPLLHRLTIGSRAYTLLAITMCIPATIAASVAFWTVPLALRTFSLQPQQVSTRLGLAVGLGSLLGTLVGGWFGDRLRRRTPNAGVWIAAVALAGSTLTMLGLLTAPDIERYLLILLVSSFFGALWSAPVAALVQELVVPSVRARGAVIFALILMLVAMCFGPYTVGRIADALGSLKVGLALLYLLVLPFALLVLATARAIPAAVLEREALLRDGGEAVPV